MEREQNDKRKRYHCWNKTDEQSNKPIWSLPGHFGEKSPTVCQRTLSSLFPLKACLHLFPLNFYGCDLFTFLFLVQSSWICALIAPQLTLNFSLSLITFRVLLMFRLNFFFLCLWPLLLFLFSSETWCNFLLHLHCYLEDIYRECSFSSWGFSSPLCRSFQFLSFSFSLPNLYALPLLLPAQLTFWLIFHAIFFSCI